MQFQEQLNNAWQSHGELRRRVPLGLPGDADAEQQVERSEGVLKRIEQGYAQHPAACERVLSSLQAAQRAFGHFLDQPGEVQHLQHAKAQLDTAEAQLDNITLEVASQAGAGTSPGGPVAAAGYTLGQQQQQQPGTGPGLGPHAPLIEGELTKHKFHNITAVQLCPSRYAGNPDLVVGLKPPALPGSLALHCPKLEVFFCCKRTAQAKLAGAAPVTCCTCDHEGYVWTGHKDGSIQVHRLEADVADGIKLKIHALPALTGGAAVCALAIDSKGHCWVGDDAGRIHIVKRLGTHGKCTLQPMPGVDPGGGAPVRAILCHEQHVVTSGYVQSSRSHFIRVWDMEHHEERTQCACSGYGAVCSFATWRLGGPQQPLPARGSSSGGASSSGGWLLVSGHDAGQVVLWRLERQGTKTRLVELGPLGSATKDSPVLGLFAYPEWSMLVVAHNSKDCSRLRNFRGTLSVWQLPSALYLVQYGTKASHPPVVIGAHDTELIGATSLGNVMVTSSAKTIRAWSPQQLADKAANSGLRFIAPAAMQQLPSSVPWDAQQAQVHLPAAGVSGVPPASSSAASWAYAHSAAGSSGAPSYISSSLLSETVRPPPYAPTECCSDSASVRSHGTSSSVPSPFASGAVDTMQPPQPSLQQLQQNMQQLKVAPSAASGGQRLQEGPSEADVDLLRQLKNPKKKDGKPQVPGVSKIGAGSSSSSSSARLPSSAGGARARPDAGPVKVVMAAAQPMGPVATASAMQGIMGAYDFVKPGQANISDSKGMVQKGSAHPGLLMERVQPSTEAPPGPLDAPVADLAAELSSHCGYHFIKVQQPPCMFGPNRALQARCNVSNRQRTVLQVARKELQQMGQQESAWAQQELLLATDLHHPHLLQVQEVFVGPVHLNVVLEECSAGRLVEFPAKHREQAAAWGEAVSPADAVPALSADFARWFFQQVVLAVDYYHAVLASNSSKGQQPPAYSSLSIKDTVLKVAPNLPQPVVKVPTALLARGLAAAAGPTAATDADRCWTPPPEDDDTRDPLARLQAADVWACGVLLVVLLGGQISKAAYQLSSTAPQTAPVFYLPGKLGAEGKGSLSELLQGMLERDAEARWPLSSILKHPWFGTSLPKSAHDMTQRFLHKGRVCKQPHEEIQAVLAALVPKRTVLLYRRPPKQQQQERERTAEQQLLPAPAVRPELAYCVRLQVNAVQQAYAALVTGCDALMLSSSGIAPLKLLVSLQVAEACASSVQLLVGAVEALQQYTALMTQQLLMGRKLVRGLDAMLLLQQSCSNALFNLSRLQELLQQSSAASGIPTQRVLLYHAQWTLISLWICSKGAHAAVSACWRSGAPRSVRKLPQPHAVDIIRAARGVARYVQYQAGQNAKAYATLAYKGARPLQQQQQQRLEVVTCVDDMSDVVVLVEEASTETGPKLETAPAAAAGGSKHRNKTETGDSASSSSFLSGCFSCKALLRLPQAGAASSQEQQQAEQFAQVQVVGLSPLVTPDYRKGLPEQRLQQHKQRMSEPGADAARKQLLQQAAAAYKGPWEQAGDNVRLAYACEAYSKDALNSLKQVLLQLQQKGHFSSIGGSRPLLLPVYTMCLRPPLLVMPQATGQTLEEWIGHRAKEVGPSSSTTAADAADWWAKAWQTRLPLLSVLRTLSSVAEGLLALHQLQPPCVHGSVHAGSVQLPQGLGESTDDRSAQLNLAGLLKQLAPVSSCHPFLAAPEAALATGPATPASDVYGFGILMFQLATGWLPQQYTAGTDEQISAVLWCRQMMATYGSTSPVAAAEDRRRLQQQKQQQQQQQQQASSVPDSKGQLPVSAAAGSCYSPYGRHLWTDAALWQLPSGYLELMARCLHTVPPARPCMVQVLAHLDKLCKAMAGCS